MQEKEQHLEIDGAAADLDEVAGTTYDAGMHGNGVERMDKLAKVALGCASDDDDGHVLKIEIEEEGKEVECLKKDEEKESSSRSDGDGEADVEGVETRKVRRRRKRKQIFDEEQHGELQQEGGVALWVKWRGKWRACIQCFPCDCSAATVKAMPTYTKKTYVVVFFPNSRTYSWVDLEYACHISESPEPLAFGLTHESGRDAVSDLGLPRTHMLRLLAANMLDISDRLPIKAVVENAQNADAWKEFSSAAVEVKEYSEISRMLVKLSEMIEPRCIKQSWLDSRISRWKIECHKAESAQSVESLNKELVNAIVWEDVLALWDAPEQSDVGNNWKDWKLTVLEKNEDVKSICPRVAVLPESRRQQPLCETLELGISDPNKKRSKLEIRRPSSDTGDSIFEASVTETSGFTGEEVATTPVTMPSQNVAAAMEDAENFGQSTEDYKPVQQLPSSTFVSKRTAGNYQLCAAYMEKKQRQCTRFPSQGSLYCCKHMSYPAGAERSSAEGVKKLEFSPPKTTTIYPKTPNDRICEGMTKYGRRCTHRAKEGSLFCKKHTFADAPHLSKDSVTGVSLSKPDEETEGNERSNKAEATALVVPDSEANKIPSLRKRKYVSSLGDASYMSAGKVIRGNSEDRVRCLGRCVSGEQCSHKSRPGASYCEKHIPDGNSHRGSTEAVAEASKHDETKSSLKAKNWLNTYMEVAKQRGDDDASNSQKKLLNWILLEASKDMYDAETLLKMVSVRKERFEKFLELQERSELPKQETLEILSSLEGVARKDISRQVEQIRCSICNDEFGELSSLGSHWKFSHSAEAHWFLKGYACKECNKEFTGRPALDRHWKAEHEAVGDVSALALCINCDANFTDFEALWDHVVDSHSDHISAMPIPVLPEETEFSGSGFRPVVKEAEHGAEVDAPKEDAKETSVAAEDKKEDRVDDDANKLDEGSNEASVGDVNLKYRCKYCGMRFKLLPDLGRHHQAEHMTCHVGTISKAKSREGLGTSSSKAKKRGKVTKDGMSSLLRIKAALQSVQQQQLAKAKRAHGHGHDKHGQGHAHENPEHDGPKNSDGLSDAEIISTASSVCCEAQLHCVLRKKYNGVPKGLFMTVLKLAMKENIVLQWTREGYACPHKCEFPVETAADRASDLRLHFYRKTRAETGSSSDGGKGATHVVCQDMSFGRESIPVPCVEDEVTQHCNCSQCAEGKSYSVDSERPWETFTYITRRMLDPSLGLDPKNSQIGCSCEGRCLSKSCEHVYLFDNDNSEACDIYGEEMQGRFSYDERGRIILQEGYLVYECNSSCPCPEDCQNRILQRGVRVKLEVFKTRHKGWAVRAAQHISRGTFVCEYLGEVLNDFEANKRGERYDQVGCSYLYDIDVHLRRSRRGVRAKPFVIDATHYGNVARFINHSCSPNLVNYQVLVESMDCQLAHIGLYASRDILCGEELAYDYRYKLLPGKGCPCHCASPGCRGRLY